MHINLNLLPSSFAIASFKRSTKTGLFPLESSPRACNSLRKSATFSLLISILMWYETILHTTDQVKRQYQFTNIINQNKRFPQTFKALKKKARKQIVKPQKKWSRTWNRRSDACHRHAKLSVQPSSLHQCWNFRINEKWKIKESYHFSISSRYHYSPGNLSANF